MPDIVSVAARSRMMSGIRAKNTKPEIQLRKILHANGYRFRLHDRSLPGQPDIVLPKHRAVIMVHGCFWHMHECSLFKLPSTRKSFWEQKLTHNALRDAASVDALLSQGWRVAIVWECALRRSAAPRGRWADTLDNWLRSQRRTLTIA
jgi:DNA mismatch endonuclease (patch repair protein)